MSAAELSQMDIDDTGSSGLHYEELAMQPAEGQGNDTTAEQWRQGQDMQGIPWERLQFTRQRYRDDRLQHYHTYLNLQQNYDENKARVAGESLAVAQTGCFFNFHRNHRAVQSTIAHFQLRNLVWASSKHDVYVMHEHKVKHWNGASGKLSVVLDLTGEVAGPQLRTGLGRVQVSTIAVGSGLVAAGGFQGELVVRSRWREGLACSQRVTSDENSITNAIEITEELGPSAPQLITSNNDCSVRMFDGQTFQCTRRLPFEWAVNFATAQPGGSGLLCVVGDDPVTILADSKSGKAAHKLAGHLDFSFAAAWHPSGTLLATGNQDKLTRVWDMRNLSRSLAVLRGCMGAIRSLRFSSDGRFLAAAEPADFVHVHDLRDGFARSQLIDVFGEVAGMSFSPEVDEFYMSIADTTYSSLLQFRRPQGPVAEWF